MNNIASFALIPLLIAAYTADADGICVIVELLSITVCNDTQLGAPSVDCRTCPAIPAPVGAYKVTVDGEELLSKVVVTPFKAILKLFVKVPVKCVAFKVPVLGLNFKDSALFNWIVSTVDPVDPNNTL